MGITPISENTFIYGWNYSRTRDIIKMLELADLRRLVKWQ